MPESTAVQRPTCPILSILKFARRLEMAEMILPDCFEAFRRYGPNDPIATATVAGGVRLLRRPGLSREPDRRHGPVRRGDRRRTWIEVEEFFRSRGVPSTVVVSPLAR